MLRKIDTSQIQYKYLIGNSTDSTPIPIYSDLQIAYGKVIEKGSISVEQPYGVETESDLAIMFNYNTSTKLISKTSILFVNDLPSGNYPNGDYKITRVGEVKNNIFTIYADKVDGINVPKVYFEYGGKIIETQFNFDSNALIGYMPLNQFIPFKVGDKVWNRKPTSNTSTSGLFRVVSIERVKNFNHNKLVFEKGV